ncbi:MmcQ/YjbR family DNA-binding protein [Eudoraea sp.]|uniref:MmcQ/YjbR family DNA-binding protein n=1 Tax=Eudoraea sp. TaxID=1979955 RepID=UPI003C73CC36
MDVEEFRSFCLQLKGVHEDFPFDKDTLVFKVMGKMFALVPLERIPHTTNLKCDPERSAILRETYDGVIRPGYHMSKLHWNTLVLDALPRDLIQELIVHSYNLVVDKLNKKDKAALAAIS